MKKGLSLFFAALFLWSGCSDEQDETSPVFNEISINGSSDNASILTGEPFRLEARLEDNEGLSRLFLEIESQQESWTYLRSFPLSGANVTLDSLVELAPEAVVGSVSIDFRLEDQAGNERSKTINAQIIDNRPQIQLLSPLPAVADNRIYLSRDTTVLFQAQVQDNEDLSQVIFKIEVIDRYVGGPRVLAEESFPLGGTDDRNFDFNGGLSVTIPQEAVNEDYELSIRAFDSKGNFRVFRQRIIVQL